ncbi:MAG TPA: hypothetical protein VEO95_01630, partial [Chthoniobacteraceae bacterium]|nr:hypothetical protein [Chthoniobacteraceae bacterium]
MSFLDRFKRKAQESTAPEATPDPRKESAPPATASKSQPASPPPAAPSRKAPDPAVQIAAAAVASGYNPEFKRAPKREKQAEAPKPAADEGEMTLELSDFLRRIPPALLRPGTPDPKTVLKFNLSELADRIARGQTTIPLYEVFKRVPTIFANEVLPKDETEIRFPWQKVMKLLAESATATPIGGLNAPAAESLAEKLKSRRATRNIVPGQVAATDMKAAAEAKAKQVRESKAGETKFKSGIEPRPAPAAEPATAASSPAPAATAAPTPAAAAADAAAAPTGDDDMLTRDELIRARDTARLGAARVKGEYERQLASLGQERKAIAEERDRLFAELAKAQKEIEDKRDQAEFEKSVAAKSGENLARLQQERDSLQRELNARDRGKAAPAPDARMAELVAERDALAQQKAQLSSELVELKKTA